MPTYSCRSYQSSYQQIRATTLLTKEFRESSYERTLLTVFIKNSSLTVQSAVVVARGLNFLVEASYVFLNLYVLGFRFESSLLKRASAIATRQFNLAGQLYWHSKYYSIYNCFAYSVNPGNAKLCDSYNLRGITQDRDYFTLSKNLLEEFGLVSDGSNSLEDILYFMLLFLEKELQSGRIKVVFYCYLKTRENDQWFEVRSFLISVTTDIFHKSFPSPEIFSI